MNKLNLRELKAEAAQRLQPIGAQARKLVLIYVVGLAAVTLLGDGIDWVLQNQIDQTGGLGGMGLRSVLQTIQSTLPIISLILRLLWSFGLYGAALKWADGRPAETGSLLNGFRRAPALLIFVLLWGGLLFGLMIFASNVASMLYMLMPGSEKLTAILYEFMQNGGTDLSTLPVQEFLSASIPLMVIFMVLFTAMALYMRYNLVLSGWYIMDEPAKGGLAAMKASLRATRGWKRELLKLDLSFWWYYALMAAAYGIVVVGLPMVMNWAGIPFNALTFVLVKLLDCVLYCGLSVWKQPYIRAAKALAFRKIMALEKPVKTENGPENLEN